MEAGRLIRTAGLICLMSTAVHAEDGHYRWGMEAAGEGAPPYSLPTHHRRFDTGIAGEPVIPFTLDEDWSVIARTILPLSFQPEIVQGIREILRLGDFQEELLLAPTRRRNFAWGAGGVLQLPTATAAAFGAGKWAVGPAAFGSITGGPWVLGASTKSIRSFAGDSKRDDLNVTTFDPYVIYSFAPGWHLSCASHIAADWRADGGSVWSVPISAGIRRVFELGASSMNAELTADHNAVTPPGRPGDWLFQIRVQLVFAR